jgi:hypothetical protein
MCPARLCMLGVGDGVQCRVRGSVVGLSGGPKQAGHRREQHVPPDMGRGIQPRLTLAGLKQRVGKHDVMHGRISKVGPICKRLHGVKGLMAPRALSHVRAG